MEKSKKLGLIGLVFTILGFGVSLASKSIESKQQDIALDEKVTKAIEAKIGS